MATISRKRWREDWRDYIAAPDARDHERERIFLQAHWRYGARIHADTADVLVGALENERVAEKRHTLFLKLFAEFVNALESLGAFGWAIGCRRDFRLFVDGFLSYPDDAPAIFYRRVLEDGATLPSVLSLPSRHTVIQAVRSQIPGGGTAREAGAWLDGGLDILRQIAEQYFTHNSMLLTNYNKAKHGATMLRLPEYTNDDLDFQVLAPQLDVDEIAANRWYNVGRFRASEDMVGPTHKNVVDTTAVIQQLSMIAWVLYSADVFYVAAAEL